MEGHRGQVACLAIHNNRLFSGGDDGTPRPERYSRPLFHDVRNQTPQKSVGRRGRTPAGTLKLWNLRGVDPLKEASLGGGITAPYGVAAVEVAVDGFVEDADAGNLVGRRRATLTVYAGVAEGTVVALPYDAGNSWLHDPSWAPAATCSAGAGVTCLVWHWDLLFAGTVAGSVAVLRPVRVADDADAVKKAAAAPPDPRDDVAIAARNRELRRVVRLERIGVLYCHSAPVAGLAPCGGLLFSAARDLAVSRPGRGTCGALRDAFSLCAA